MTDHLHQDPSLMRSTPITFMDGTVSLDCYIFQANMPQSWSTPSVSARRANGWVIMDTCSYRGQRPWSKSQFSTCWIIPLTLTQWNTRPDIALVVSLHAWSITPQGFGSCCVQHWKRILRNYGFLSILSLVSALGPVCADRTFLRTLLLN